MNMFCIRLLERGTNGHIMVYYDTFEILWLNALQKSSVHMLFNRVLQFENIFFKMTTAMEHAEIKKCKYSFSFASPQFSYNAEMITALQRKGSPKFIDNE